MGADVDRDEFAALVCEAFRQAGIDDLRYDPATFSIELGGRGRALLDNIHSGYRQIVPPGRELLIAGFVASVLSERSVEADFHLAKPYLLPIIRSESYISLNNLASEAGGLPGRMNPLATRVLVEGLDVGFARDFETGLAPIDKARLDAWGVGYDEALSVATDNLRRVTSRDGLVQERRGLYVSHWEDAYDSARLLMTDLIAGLPLRGSPVIFVPNRDRLLITGRDDPSGIAEMLTLGEPSLFDESYPLSPYLYILAEGAWRLHVPADPEIRNLWLAMKERRKAIDYAWQQKSLETVLAARDIATFVASYGLRTLGDGTTRSYCTWSKDVDSFLPETDDIAFFDPAGDPFLVAWNDAVDLVGALMEKDSALLPPRYRVRNFPDPAQVRSLQALSKE